MTPVDMTSTCVGVDADTLRPPQAAICRGVAVALVAGAGVGVAGVDHHDADRFARRPLAAELHRRGEHEILREHARRRRPAGRRRPATGRASAAFRLTPE